MMETEHRLHGSRSSRLHFETCECPSSRGQPGVEEYDDIMQEQQSADGIEGVIDLDEQLRDRSEALDYQLNAAESEIDKLQTVLKETSVSTEDAPLHRSRTRVRRRRSSMVSHDGGVPSKGPLLGMSGGPAALSTTSSHGPSLFELSSSLPAEVSSKSDFPFVAEGSLGDSGKYVPPPPPPPPRPVRDVESLVRASNSMMMLTGRLKQQQLDVARLTDENEDLRGQLEAQVSCNARYQEEVMKLRKEEMEAKQREVMAAAHTAKLETQVMDMRSDVDRLLAMQQELLGQVESKQEELEQKSEELAEARSRIDEAEGRLAKVMEDQTALVRVERRRERKAQLARMRQFEDRLRTATEQFKAARQRIEELHEAIEEQGEELQAAKLLAMSTQDEFTRRKELVGKYEVLVKEQSQELTTLRSRAEDCDVLRARCQELQERVGAAEMEVNRQIDHGQQCASLLEVVEEQQKMIVTYKDRQQELQDELRRLLIQEADFKARARQWQRERAAFEKDQRELKHQLKKALMLNCHKNVA